MCFHVHASLSVPSSMYTLFLLPSAQWVLHHLICVCSHHRPISCQCVGVRRINTALERQCVLPDKQACLERPGQAPASLWVPVAEINGRYDCYLSPRGCCPLSGATSGLFDEYVALISFNLLCFLRARRPLSAFLVQYGVFPQRVSVNEG